MNSTNQLTPVKTVSVPSLLIRPVASNNEIVEAWDRYQELKTKLLTASDYQEIAGKKCIKKSGWRKLQVAFGVSDEVIKEERKEFSKNFIYEVTIKVSTQNGRFAFGVGSCSSGERSFAHVDHDVRAIACTRAKNRAISDLIGGGEVSADELSNNSVERPATYTKVIEEKKPETSVSYSESRNWGREYEANKISDRQKALLTSLITENSDSDDDRQTQLDNLPSLSKSDASEMISELINAKKVNSY